MTRETTPRISMDRGAHYVTQSSLWSGPQFLRSRKHKRNVYRRLRAPKVDEKEATFNELIRNALLA